MIVRSVKDLGALVRDQRKKLGWSQSELAAQIGVQRLWVSQFEGGKATVHIGLVMRTLRALDLEVDIGKHRPPETHTADVKMVDLDAILEANTNRGSK